MKPTEQVRVLAVMYKRAFNVPPTAELLQQGTSALKRMSAPRKAAIALGLGTVGVGGGYLASKGKPSPAPAPVAPPEPPPSAASLGGLAGALLPTALGGVIGAGGAALGGNNPIRGAATGIGTGLGFTAGGIGGNALANYMQVQDPRARLLLGLGGAGLGAYLGNRVTNKVVGNKKRREDDID